VPEPCTNEVPAADQQTAEARPADSNANPPSEQPEAADGVEPFKELLKRSRPEDASEDAEAKA